MNSGLTSALSKFAKRSGFSKNPFATEPSDGPPLHPSELNRITRARLWLSKVAAPFAFARFLIIFFIGVAATLTWQSYGGAAREAIATWSPHLGWLAPPAAPAGASPDQLAAVSRGLAVVRQSIDKLAADITRLEAIQQGAIDRTPTPPPSPARVPAHKPVPLPSRTPPVR
jgi:hypothetical protein